MANFADNKVEIFVDEVLKIENREASFAEYAVQVIFSMEELGDQRIFQESSLESAPFGTNSNYRRKLQVK